LSIYSFPWSLKGQVVKVLSEKKKQLNKWVEPFPSFSFLSCVNDHPLGLYYSYVVRGEGGEKGQQGESKMIVH
jgi:hypothetical protein